MKSRWSYIIGVLVLCLMASGYSSHFTQPIYFEVPKGWPKPYYNGLKNQLSQEGFELGKALFYDPILSRDASTSCASCHLQATGFTHVDHALSHGIEDRIGTRNALALINLAWNKTFMWDGGVNHIEMQPLAPITNPLEMDETLAHVVEKLQKSTTYPDMFERAFGSKKITGQLTLKALSQFLVMLTSTNSKYDKVMRKETTFTSQEEHGYRLFQANCASCHQEPLFTNHGFENNGLPVDPSLNDWGRMKITQDPTDSLKFKVPTLRNIQFTYPYMHDGRLTSLTAVIKHYNSAIQPSKTLAKQLQKPMLLSDNDRVDLVAFLLTLTDNEFLFNPQFKHVQK